MSRPVQVSSFKMLQNIFYLQIFSENSHIQLLLPFLGKFYFQKIITAIALFFLFLDKKRFGHVLKSFGAPHGKVMLFLFLWMVLSIPFSIYPGLSFRFITENFWKVIASFLIVVAYTGTRKDFERLVWTYIAAIGVLCVATLFFLESGEERTSISEGIYDPNDTALQFLMALPFLAWTFFSTKGFWKLLTGAIAIMLLAAIIATQSRGAFVGLIVTLLVIVYQMRHSIRYGWLKAALVAGVLAALVVFYGSTEYTERIATLFNPSEDYNLTSSTGRIELWKRGLDMMFNNPLFGVGIYTFLSADGMLYADAGSRWNAAHNSFIQLGAELGLPGIIAFLILIIGIMVRLKRVDNGSGKKFEFASVYSKALLASFVAYLAAGFFLSAAYITPLYFLFGMSFAFLRLEGATVKAPTVVRKPAFAGIKGAKLK